MNVAAVNSMDALV